MLPCVSLSYPLQRTARAAPTSAKPDTATASVKGVRSPWNSDDDDAAAVETSAGGVRDDEGDVNDEAVGRGDGKVPGGRDGEPLGRGDGKGTGEPLGRGDGKGTGGADIDTLGSGDGKVPGGIDAKTELGRGVSPGGIPMEPSDVTPPAQC
jgi:hypothetical protein